MKGKQIVTSRNKNIIYILLKIIEINCRHTYQIKVLMAESWIDPRYKVARCDTCGMISSMHAIRQQNP